MSLNKVHQKFVYLVTILKKKKMRISIILENMCILFCFSLSFLMFGLDAG